MEKDFVSIPEFAKIIGVSRIAVYKMVKKGSIKAKKIGRNYAISCRLIDSILGKSLSNNDKKEIDEAVKKTVNEYGEVLKMLGEE